MNSKDDSSRTSDAATDFSNQYMFLHGGGAVGELIRNYEWSPTVLGSIDTWPQSLRTAISMVLNSAYPMLIMWGSTDYIQFYNDAFIQILGKKHPAALGKSAASTWKELWSDVGPLVADVFASGKTVVRRNLPLKTHRNGYHEQVYFDFSYSPIRGEYGEVAGMYCVCIETTEQLKTEQALLAEQNRLREILMQTPAILAVVTGPNHVFELANPMYMQLIGKRQVIGKTVRQALPDTAGQGFDELLDTVYKTGTFYSSKETHVSLDSRRDGTRDDLYLDFSYQALRGANNIIDGVIVHAVDVTEQVQTRQRIQDSESRYRNLFNAIDQGFCVFEMLYDASGKAYDYRFLEINHMFAQQTGLENAVGKTILEVAPTHEKQWFELYGKVADSGEPLHIVDRAEALHRWFDIHAYRIGEPDKHIVAALFTDISELKQAEAERKQSEHDMREKYQVEQRMLIVTEQRNNLARLNKTKDDFIALSSHQLRTPATAVKQYIGLVLGDFAGPVDPQQRTYLQTAYDSNERQLTIIDDLLKTAQLDSDKYTFNKKQYDIVHLVTTAIDHMKPTLVLKQQTIKFMSHEKAVTAVVDETEFRLALMNLLENASKYSFASTAIDVSLRQDSGYVYIAVIDRGVGISAEDSLRIFDKFTRVNNSLSDTVTGSGLGLYLAKQIVELHDGNLTLDSKLGKGSTFTIRLPLHG